jgi:3-methylcrotonyl-CoA carboxylase alpha subunit
MREKLKIEGEAVDVTASLGADGSAVIRLGEQELAVEHVRRENGVLSFTYAGTKYRFHLRAKPDSVEVTDGRGYYRFPRIEEGMAAEDEAGGDELVSQMPGTVLKLLATPGDEVAKSTPLLILEAMKMEHEICAPADGKVTAYPYNEGDRVMPGDLLVEFEAVE